MHWWARWMSYWCDFGSTARNPSSQRHAYSLEAHMQKNSPDYHIYMIINIYITSILKHSPYITGKRNGASTHGPQKQ